MFWPQRMSGEEMCFLWDFPGSQGLVPGQGTKIPHAAWYSQKKKKKADTEMGLLWPCLPKGSKITQLVDGLVGLSAASRHQGDAKTAFIWTSLSTLPWCLLLELHSFQPHWFLNQFCWCQVVLLNNLQKSFYLIGSHTSEEISKCEAGWNFQPNRLLMS